MPIAFRLTKHRVGRIESICSNLHNFVASTHLFFTAYYDIEIMAEHIPGVTKMMAYHLSRNNVFSWNPQVHPY